jgi:hypothetical protein
MMLAKMTGRGETWLSSTTPPQPGGSVAGRMARSSAVGGGRPGPTTASAGRWSRSSSRCGTRTSTGAAKRRSWTSSAMKRSPPVSNTAKSA